MTSDSQPDTDESWPHGTPAWCTECKAPIVVYESPEYGYRLVCACEDTYVDLTNALANESLFTPLSGRWSNVDDIDPWDDLGVDFD